MTDPLFERLAELRPQLAAQVRLYPQTFRGERWFVLANEASGRYLRLNARAYAAIGRFDGNVQLRDLHELLGRRGADLSEAELAALLLQLADADALREPLPDDVQALNRQGGKRPGGKATFNPLAIRFRLADPDRFLEQTMPWVAPLFTYIGGLLLLAVVALAAILGVLHINELANAVNVSLLSPGNLALGWLTFVAMKFVHEFAHAYSVKRWGGEVHEMGISLLVLMPVPYVDATAAWAFRSKYRRALVGAAGIIVELVIAAIALLVFLMVEPGTVRSVALNALLIGAVSTLLINGNPLLRFDGYYVLQDLLELPNLSTRASAFLRYLVQRYGLGIQDARPPVMCAGERGWLAGYGIAAALYRIFILAVIGLYLVSTYLVVGVALITWAVVMQIIVPAARALHFTLTVKCLSGRRLAATARVAALPIMLLAALALVPVGQSTESQGVVWLPEQAQVYARADGFVSAVHVNSSVAVDAGQPILTLVNEDLLLRRAVIDARRRELAARKVAQQFGDRSAAEVAAEEMQAVFAELERLDEQLGALEIRAEQAGTLVFVEPHRMAGRYVRQGDLIAYVVDPAAVIVRAVVPQRDIGRLREGITNVEVRLAERLAWPLAARIVRETPSGLDRLPSRALARSGGGTIETEPGDGEGLRTTSRVFNVDLALPAGIAVSGIGGRAYVRYEHARAPLFSQWLQRLRQLVLRRLSA